jgi:exodeoxyribonuclease V alpha subunit
MKLGTQQLRAIDQCTNPQRRLVAVSGPAGSGKTTIMKKAVQTLRNQGRQVALAAPTGRAARRISEATGYPATTVHKLLAYGKPEIDDDTGLPKEETRPAYGDKQRLGYTDIFIDEFAMVTERLYRDIMAAMPTGGRLLAFGDIEQLPPIEPYSYVDYEGSPFQQLLKLPGGVVLDTVYRQDQESGLFRNATRIRAGKPPTKTSDFDIQLSETPIRKVLDIVSSVDGFQTTDKQVIVPTKKQELGTHTLNGVIQAVIGPKGVPGVFLPREKWEEKYNVKVHPGDKVICNENLYDMRDFFERYYKWDGDVPEWSSFIPCPDTFTILNGEIGIVEDVLPDGSLHIQLYDRIVQMPASYREYNARYNHIYDRDPRKKIDLAYAVTTHKMQGSECQEVIYVIHRSIGWSLNRNNVYTGVTRAREKVTFIACGQSLQSCVRYTSQQKDQNRKLAKDAKTFSVGDMKKEESK